MREDPYLVLACHVLQLKLGLSQPGHQCREAEVPHEAWTRAHVAVRAEYLSLRALVAVASGDRETALKLAQEAVKLSTCVESIYNARFATLIANIIESGRTQELERAAIELIRDCANAEAYEALVLAARASDVWVPFATTDAAAESIIKRTLVRSEDLALARDAGLSTEEIEGLETILTAREREVLKHVRRGLSNSAIASELFISESTVKVHVHHILEKLNVKTRLQAALKTAESDSSNAG